MNNNKFQKILREIDSILPSVCSCTSISVPELFDHYEKTRFLYADKKKRIAPYMDLVKTNWESALRAKEKILWTSTCRGVRSEQMATVTLWRSTKNGLMAQHLAAEGPDRINRQTCALAAMLVAQINALRNNYNSGQNWFRPDNKYACKIFGTIVGSLGEKLSSLNNYKYLAFKPTSKQNTSKSVVVLRCDNKNKRGIYDIVNHIRGSVYADAEEFGSDDIELMDIDEIYKTVGLRRKRYIWIAVCKKSDKLLGAAVAYRGPLGFNFSFLENRCDLLIDKELNDNKRTLVCEFLLESAIEAYFESDIVMEYPLNFIPVVADEQCADLLQLHHKSKILREYNQSIWLKDGFKSWLEHTEKIFQQVLNIEKKRTLKK